MSTHKPAFFFAASQSVDDSLGKTFNFIWASYAGLRELWWQVRGFNTNFPGLHISQIEKKFFSGLPLPGGVDLKQICINNNWDVHEDEFSKWLLFDACTLYEGWAEKVCSQVFNSTHAEKCSKQIQFPSDLLGIGNPSGYILAVQRANQNISNFIKAEFFPSLSQGKYNKWIHIQEYLIAYRYFKECRNAFIHSDGKVTQEVMSAQGHFLNILTPTQIIFKHSFSTPTNVLGSKIKLNINDVIFFTRVVKSLIATFDAALSVSLKCELVLENRMKSLTSENNKWDSLPANKIRREQRIHRMLSASKIPEPVSISSVDAWMISKGIIKF
jgi:hypothetical protein